MTNRKSKSPTTPVAPPESLIIGNGVAARACLEWIQEIDRTLRELGRALQPALGAEAVGETARNILMIRLHNAAVEHASSLTRLQQRHQEVVTNAVWAWVGPVIDEARDACRDIMDIASKGRLRSP